jgi:hypothetical protein
VTGLGRLALDCIWIAGDGHAKPLDFRVPRVAPDLTPISPVSVKSAQEFLATVATMALTGGPHGASTYVGLGPRHQLPLSASALLDALDRGAAGSGSDVVRRVTTLMDRPVRVERRRRAATLALSVTIPIGRAIPPEIQELLHALNIVSASSYGALDRSALDNMERPTSALQGAGYASHGPLNAEPHTKEVGRAEVYNHRRL